MPTTSSTTDLCNLALSKIGASLINSLLDQTNTSAIACNVNFPLAYLEVSRAARWNCLLTTASLVAVVQTPIPPVTPIGPYTAWAPLTAYLANAVVTYGGYYYTVMFNYTSTVSFLNDLTTGALTQTDLPTSGSTFGAGDGSLYPSSWAYGYALPADFQLLDTLNDQSVWNGTATGCGGQYEIIGANLYTNDATATIKYVRNQPDVTQFDALMASALTFKLASMIATTLRQDGGKMEQMALMEYKSALREARTKNAGERMPRRFNPINTSRFVQSRFYGVNG